ncbi:MAG: hypothetical protein JO314_03160 [Acidobacteria bacterium]|nr:hypothetical protein [Acidobacteriota bacterium]
MKTVVGILMLGALAIGALAQEKTETAKVMAELSMTSPGMKGQPFSAETVSESVQTLADGNRIVQSSNGKIYRNSEGKVRREVTGGNGNVFFGPGISIMDPFGRQNIWLDSEGRTARAVTIVPQTTVKVRTPVGEGSGAGAGMGIGIAKSEAELTAEQKKAVEILKGHKEGDPLTAEQQKAMEALKSVSIARAGVVLADKGAALTRSFAASTEGNWFVGGPGDSKWETKTEELGTQNIEGVNCDGVRHVTTIPAGAIGNERPIEITYERWYSKELGMVVMSKHSDPRFGEQTYTLKNIIRSEPDPSLFTVPQGWKVMSPGADGGFTYTVRTGDGERTVTRAKSATTPTAPKQP